jgi:hypothetical protein
MSNDPFRLNVAVFFCPIINVSPHFFRRKFPRLFWANPGSQVLFVYSATRPLCRSGSQKHNSVPLYRLDQIYEGLSYFRLLPSKSGICHKNVKNPDSATKKM